VRAARGEEIGERAEQFNKNYLRLFDAFLRLYSHQYPLMGNAQVMTAKAAWDNGAYWAISALLYFQRRYRQMEFMNSIEPFMRRFFVLHARMQQLFNAWDHVDQREYEDAHANVVGVGFLRNLQASLSAPVMDDDTLRETLNQNLSLIEAFAGTWQTIAIERNPSLPRFVAADGPVLDISPLVLQPRGESRARRTA
jgi:hypothetical protein